MSLFEWLALAFLFGLLALYSSKPLLYWWERRKLKARVSRITDAQADRWPR